MHDDKVHSSSNSSRLFNADHTFEQLAALESRMLREYRATMRATSTGFREHMHRLPSVAFYHDLPNYDELRDVDP